MRNNYRYTRNCHCNKYCNEIKPLMLENACEDVQSNMYVCPEMKDECSCGFDEYLEDNGLPLNPILAQAYVQIQRMGKTFIPSAALKMGTVFPELVRPYVPNQSMMIKEIVAAGNVIGEGCNYGI